jgi:phosphoribosylanthranilate isomerase
VKICGITRTEDGIAALEAGADAIGVVLAARSSRHVAPTPAGAGALLGALRAAAGDRAFLAVAVLDDPDPAAGRQAIDGLGFDRVQFHAAHGVPALADCLATFEDAAARAWGAVAVADAASLVGADDLRCEAVLLDTHVAGRTGGTGVTFDWELAAPLARRRRVVLAGGLTPENVADAIGVVRPWMVDVSSGVEADHRGVKDAARVRAFIAAARHA